MAPTPKHPSARARRNKASTARTLHTVPSLKVPALPSERDWHAMTVAWWTDVWSSPMAPEYDDSDRHGLFMLAVLVDQFWQEPKPGLAAEIRLQRQCFGLTPIDRRRLQWEIDRGEVAVESTKKRRTATQPKPAEDPRALLA